MILKLIETESEYVGAEELLRSKNALEGSFLREPNSVSFIVKSGDSLLGLATLSEYRGFPLLKHFVVNSNSLGSGRVLLRLIGSIEVMVTKLGFDSFGIDVGVMRCDALTAVRKYFKDRIIKTRDAMGTHGKKRLFLVRV